MRLTSTLTVLTLILALASCSKSPAPSTSFIATKYLGIDHLYTCKGLEQEGNMYVINGDETGSVNKLKLTLTNVQKGNYNAGPATDNIMEFDVDGATYSTRVRRASGSMAINQIDSVLFNIHANLTAHLINVSDSTDYLDVGGEFNIKYKY